MSEYDEIQVSEWLRDGIAAAKAGRREQARDLLMQVIEVNERSEQAWLWLSGLVDTDQDRLICLENVLALNPDNAQARAGLKWLQEQGVGVASPVEERQAGADVAIDAVPEQEWVQEGEESRAVAVESFSPSASHEPESFMTPDGCVYCGLPAGEEHARCPHCGNWLVVKRFERKERSTTAYLLQPAWTVLAGLNLIQFALIGVISDRLDDISHLIMPFLDFVVGQAVTDPASVDVVVEIGLLVQIVRYTLVGLAVLGGLVGVGLLLRLSWVHLPGIALIALHLVGYIVLYIMGFLGYLSGVFLGGIALLVTLFMFQTVEDFSLELYRERLEPDRHVLNDADFYTRGRAYRKRGMWAKALLHWQRAVAINPDRDTYLAALAQAYARLGRYDMALTQLDEAQRVSRTPEEWHALRDVILEAQKRATVEG